MLDFNALRDAHRALDERERSEPDLNVGTELAEIGLDVWNDDEINEFFRDEVAGGNPAVAAAFAYGVLATHAALHPEEKLAVAA